MRKFINMRTELPGPIAKSMLDRRIAAVARAPYHTLLSFIHHAHGAILTDVDGNTFIDFAGAIGTLNVGHSPKQVTDAIHAQIDQYIHTCFHVVMYEPYIELAETLNKLTPGDVEKKTMFFNSGAEAIENAIKVAKRFTKRRGVISFERGFHGRTYMALSLTSKNKPYKTGLGPFLTDTYKCPYPDYYHMGSLSEDALDDHLLQRIEQMFLTEIPVYDIACVVMEPEQGEGGFIVPSQKFVKGIKALCERYGMLFISDEIQSGFGRTGKFFAIEHHDVVPDLITMSKSIAAGMPLSALTGRADVMDAADIGEIGGTYGGSPVSCAAALEVIKLIHSENLLERAVELGNQVRLRLTGLQNTHDFIGDIRGLGSMLAIEIVKDPTTKMPDSERTNRIIKYALDHGLIILTAGIYGNVIRLLYPLVISDEQLQEGLDVLAEAIEHS